MKNLITIMSSLLIFSTALAAIPTTRQLTETEAKHFTAEACNFFSRVYYNLTVNIEKCKAGSSFKTIRENDPRYGTYIFGKLQYGSGRSTNCNLIIDPLNPSRIDSIDCGNE